MYKKKLAFPKLQSSEVQLGQDSDIAYRKDREKISLELSTVFDRETGIPELLDDGFFWQQ
jgi:hypothetical protein